MSRSFRCSALAAGLALLGCSDEPATKPLDGVELRWCTQFGPPPDGEPVMLIAAEPPAWLPEFMAPFEVNKVLDVDYLTMISNKAVRLDDAAWTGRSQLRVTFIDQTCRGVRRDIEQFAAEWHPHIGLRFQFAPGVRRDGDIRISCRGPGYWSTVGAVGEPPPNANGATMNLGGLLREREPRERRAKVLHEFGHALGAVHEHQSPLAQIKWKEREVFDYYWRAYRWSEDVVRAEVFRQYRLDEVDTVRLDPESIMMYPIPPGLTEDGFHVDPNYELSTDDRLFMGAVYPR